MLALRRGNWRQLTQTNSRHLAAKTTMTKLNIFWISAAMAASDIAMLSQFAGTWTAIVYAVLTGTALFLMVQAAIAQVDEK